MRSVDRGRGNRRNIMGVIVDRNSNVKYRIAIHAGVFNGNYSRNQIDFCIQNLLTERDVFPKDQEVVLRKAVQMESKCGCQWFQKCNCACFFVSFRFCNLLHVRRTSVTSYISKILNHKITIIAYMIYYNCAKA